MPIAQFKATDSLVWLKDRFFQQCFIIFSDQKLQDTAFLKTGIIKDRHNRPFSYSALQAIKAFSTRDENLGFVISKIIPAEKHADHTKQFLDTARIYAVTEYVADQILEQDLKNKNNLTQKEIIFYKKALLVLKQEVQSNSDVEFLTNLLQPIVQNLRFKFELPSDAFFDVLVKTFPRRTDLLKMLWSFDIDQADIDSADLIACQLRIHALNYKMHTAYLKNLNSLPQDAQQELVSFLTEKLAEIFSERAKLIQLYQLLPECDMVKIALQEVNLLLEACMRLPNHLKPNNLIELLSPLLIKILCGEYDEHVMPDLRNMIFDLRDVQDLLAHVSPKKFFQNVARLSNDPLVVSIYKREFLSLITAQHNAENYTYDEQCNLTQYIVDYLLTAYLIIKQQLDAMGESHNAISTANLLVMHKELLMYQELQAALLKATPRINPHEFNTQVMTFLEKKGLDPDVKWISLWNDCNDAINEHLNAISNHQHRLQAVNKKPIAVKSKIFRSFSIFSKHKTKAVSRHNSMALSKQDIELDSFNPHYGKFMV